MIVMEENRFPYGKTGILSLGMFATNMALSVFVIYVPLFVRRNFLATFSDSTMINTVVGFVMILDNIVALFIQPAVGAWSDRIWVKKLGRRMPFIIVGIPLSAFFLGMIGTFEETLIWLLVAITFFNISMAIFKSPVLALIPDFLPQSFRSQGSGVVSVVGGVASILGLFLTAYLYEIQHELAFWAIAAIMIFCLIILIFNVHEDPDRYAVSDEAERGFGKIFKNLRKEDNNALIYALIAVFFNQCGYQVAESFLSSYVVSVLEFSETQANYVLGTLAIFAILAAIPAGLLGKKYGARNAALFGVILFCLSTIPIAIFSLVSPEIVQRIFTLNSFTIDFSFFLILAQVLLLGFSMTLISINLLVVIWDMASKRKIATYTGYFYLFAHSAAIISPFLAGIIFDFIERTFSINGLQGLFAYVDFMYLGAIFALFKVRKIQKTHVQSLSPEERELLQKKAKKRTTLLLPWILFGFGARENPLKAKRKELKKDLKMFEDNFEEFMKDGDLSKQQLKQAIKALRKEHRKEIKAFKRHLLNSRRAKSVQKSILEEDLKLFEERFMEFVKDGDLKKRQYREDIKALKQEHKRELKEMKKKLMKGEKIEARK